MPAHVTFGSMVRVDVAHLELPGLESDYIEIKVHEAVMKTAIAAES